MRYFMFILTLIIYSLDFIESLPAPRLFREKSCNLLKDEVCIEIRQCPYFVDLLDNAGKPRPRKVINAIRSHQCGFMMNAPKVCCTLPKIAATTERADGDEENEMEVLQPAMKAPNGAPDVSKHKNFGLLPKNCGPTTTSARIMGGLETSLNEFPWMALIAYVTNNGLDFRCGGTLINDRYILTAAHCIMNLTIVGVRLGEYDINSDKDCNSDKSECSPGVQDFYIEDTIIHKDYIQSTFNNDIGLIRLAKPVNFSSAPNVKPICLPLGNAANFNINGKFAIVSGWGVTETGYKSAKLLKISVPVVPNSRCQQIYKNFATIGNRQICAGGYLGRDSCGGDSGGPLKYVGIVDSIPKYIQHGLVSYGPRHCGTDGQPGVYTRISYYMDWILDNMKP